MESRLARVGLVQLLSPEGEWQNVGRLVNNDEITRFESDEGYWRQERRLVLGQIFEENEPTWRPSQRVSVPTWFSHLLPEGYLRSAVALATSVNPKREFPMLLRLGRDDLPGAVRIVLAEPSSVDLGLAEPLTSENVEAPEDAVLKFSLAGVQPKFSVVMTNARGLTIPARGQAGDWIVKLPDGRPGFGGVPQSELAGLELARRIGIPTPEAMLFEVADIEGLPGWARSYPGDALAVKRFDRKPNGGRVHAEVLAQVLDVPTTNERLKYVRANFETVASLIGALCGPDAIFDVVDRIVLNVVIGNGDAHLKNWALTYPNGVLPALSPAYDIVPTVLYIENDDLGLKLDGSREFGSVTPASFDRMANRTEIEVRHIRTRVARAVELIIQEWPVLKEFLPQAAYQRLTARRDLLPLVGDS
ncbi:type II toxin-antitoxin system HipA family toxin [Solwaraspora sp. WMMA2056]|uniref:type II toxin-antitoxin system HipA family toxin n=1 Tax=Solwaraspora sp. WMMA2056 TaxID=3015161 RepID=UPI00259BE30E|nr:type II toxin-antitoxin system HipA family toxin [Solwaraspora sp. WMMA2056]WJK41250.1 type II toxin-antitoxin system HipA family toxin [Solwaraspora sp. WMMA2056]